MTGNGLQAMPALCGQCQVADPASFLETCGAFYRLLTEENKKYNLIRIHSEPDFWYKHVADCILLGKYFPDLASQPVRLLDVGSGAGLPALLLAAAYPRLKVTALDSSHKKADFIRMAAGILRVPLTVLTARAGELNRQAEWRQRFEVVTARAVAEARKIFSEVRHLVGPGGKIILYKTPAALAEIRAVAPLFEKYGWRWEASAEFALPEDSGRRLFIVGRRT
jgi:16S rRNA (guanine527-N7)-methyltransferase